MPVTFVAAGAAAAGADVASLTPALPAGIQPGDVIVCFTSASFGAATITPDARYSTLGNRTSQNINHNLVAKTHVAGDAPPTIGFSLVAGKTVISQCAAFRGLMPAGAVTNRDQLGANSNGATTQDIGPIAGITPSFVGTLILLLGAKRDSTGTGVATASGDGLTWNEIGENHSALGTTSLVQVWDYAIDPALTTVTAKTLAVTGGVTANWCGFMLNLKQYGTGGVKSGVMFASLDREKKGLAVWR